MDSYKEDRERIRRLGFNRGSATVPEEKRYPWTRAEKKAGMNSEEGNAVQEPTEQLLLAEAVVHCWWPPAEGNGTRTSLCYAWKPLGKEPHISRNRNITHICLRTQADFILQGFNTAAPGRLLFRMYFLHMHLTEKETPNCSSQIWIPVLYPQDKHHFDCSRTLGLCQWSHRTKNREVPPRTKDDTALSSRCEQINIWSYIKIKTRGRDMTL